MNAIMIFGMHITDETGQILLHEYTDRVYNELKICTNKGEKFCSKVTTDAIVPSNHIYFDSLLLIGKLSKKNNKKVQEIKKTLRDKDTDYYLTNIKDTFAYPIFVFTQAHFLFF